jgi:hypothetical protein
VAVDAVAVAVDTAAVADFVTVDAEVATAVAADDNGNVDGDGNS